MNPQALQTAISAAPQIAEIIISAIVILPIIFMIAIPIILDD